MEALLRHPPDGVRVRRVRRDVVLVEHQRTGMAGSKVLVATFGILTLLYTPVALWAWLSGGYDPLFELEGTAWTVGYWLLSVALCWGFGLQYWFEESDFTFEPEGLSVEQRILRWRRGATYPRRSVSAVRRVAEHLEAEDEADLAKRWGVRVVGATEGRLITAQPRAVAEWFARLVAAWASVPVDHDD